MLSSDFNNEMASLVRSLEGQVRQHPHLMVAKDLPVDVPLQQETLTHIEKAIITLVALHIELRRRENPRP